MILFVVLLTEASAQTGFAPLNDAYLGLTASSNIQVDGFGASLHPASLPIIHEITTGLYAERPFLLNQLAFYQLVFILPTQSGGFSMLASQKGDQAFSQRRIGFSYGRSLWSIMNLGISFNYFMMQMGSYGASSALGFSVSSLYHINKNTNAGLEFENFGLGRFSKLESLRMPAIVKMNLGYDVSELVFVAAGLRKEENKPVNLDAGISYRVIPAVEIRLGVSTANSLPWFGAGWSKGLFKWDIIASYHARLGLSPSVSCQWSKKSSAR